MRLIKILITASTILLEKSNKINLITLKKIINNKQSKLHELFKSIEAYLPLSYWCSTLWSSFVIFFWYYWIYFIEIFLTIPVVLSLDFRYVFIIFFLFFFLSFFSLSPLSLLNLMSINFTIWESCKWHLKLGNHRYL